jgi:anti-anti-sigma regulatory factor
METRRWGAESIIAAPRRQDRWEPGGELGGRTALLAPPGRFDGTAAEWLTRDAQALILTGCRSFILDLRHSDSVDTQGAWGLLSLRSEVSRRGGRVRLVVTEGSQVERRLRLLEFGALFPIYRAAEGSWRA